MSKRLNPQTETGHQNDLDNIPKKLKIDPEEYRDWSCDEVRKYFNGKGFTETANMLRKENIQGKDLCRLTDDMLEKIGIITMGDRLDAIRTIEQLQDRTMDTDKEFGSPTNSPSVNPGDYKIFNDPIHGHIEIHPLCVKIIDTPQFQRLRYLKQLGGCYFVFPGATHNRFEHCIGVCHLAGELVNAIRGRQPELDITDKDILCVQIAGLCHDLGHGPFSHMFDSLFIPRVRPGYKWQHEKASVDMFDHMLEVNPNLEAEFQKFGLNEIDKKFIKEQIAGPLYRDKNNVQKMEYEGRDLDTKGFLYEIVANKRNGIDVDKWDYFGRDCHHLGISSNFDHSRFMKFSRVIRDGGQMQICNRDKEVGNIYDMFYTRSVLHRRAYQHKTANIIEIMICEALEKADEHIRIRGSDGKDYKISQCIDNMSAYTKLTDYIYLQILHSTDDKLSEAREILERIERRELYKSVGQTKPVRSDAMPIKQDSIPQMCEEIATAMVDEFTEMPVVTKDDLVVSIVHIDYGKKYENPMDNVRYYSKDNPNKATQIRKEQWSQMLPERFCDQYIRVCSRKSDKQSISNLQRCFRQWCKNRDMVEPKDGDIFCLDYMTPLKPSPVKPELNDQENIQPDAAKKLIF